jgi:hypothetical protein
MMSRKTDAKGRSTGQLVHFAGRAKRWKLEGQFIPHTLDMRESPGFRALTMPARRVLDFLELEHLRHGGAENGNLLAPYAQLVTWGVTKRDIAPAIATLVRFGFIRRTEHGQRLGGRPNATRYALTWLPTSDGQLPTEDFRKVSRSDVLDWEADRRLQAEAKRTRKALSAAKI